MAEAINWHCPHCHHKVTITEERQSVAVHYLMIGNVDGKLALRSDFRVCPNQDCRKASLSAALYKWEYYYHSTQPHLKDAPTRALSIIPSSYAHSFPDYVPQVIRDDYVEGCVIRDLSPKASATLARRALQGILRDFYQVNAGRLVDEIKQLKDAMEPELWDAIDAVRKIGNIGAHMEADINVIVEVDPDEAQLLLELVETMIEETYVRRAERQARLAKVSALAAEKQRAKRPPAMMPPSDEAESSDPAA